MNNSIFNGNVDLLKSLNRETLISDDFYQVETTMDNKLTFKLGCNEKKIYINSKYNVNDEIDMLLKDIDFNKDRLFIVYGIGLGYHIRELIKRSSENSIIFVIETDMKILNTYLKNKSLLDICCKKTILLLGNDQQIISQISLRLGNVFIIPLAKNYTPIISVPYYSLYGDRIASINKRIIDLIEHTFFIMGNDVEDTITGLENNFKNIKDLIVSPSIELIKNKYTNLPAIIVSAGPSLDKNIKELRNAQGKALILATDAVISTLSKHNIKPDAIFTVERGIENYNKFYNDNYIDKEIVFIGPPVVTKKILQKMKSSKKLLCLKKGEKINEWINYDILGENRLIYMGTSCAHVAFGFAKYVNANPIIFVGQDLAYSKEGVTHSKDVEVKRNIDKDDDSLIYIKGINGEMLPTNNAFKNFLVFLETEIAKDISGRIYIDATEGGAFKIGTKIMSLKDVIDEYCNKDVIKLYNLVPEDRELDMSKYNKAIDELKRLEERFSNLKIDCFKLYKKLKNLENISIELRIDNKKLLNTLKDKQHIEQIIYREDIIRTFLQCILVTKKVEEISVGNIINKQAIIEKVKIYKEQMTLLVVACDTIHNAINEMIKNMVNN